MPKSHPQVLVEHLSSGDGGPREVSVTPACPCLPWEQCVPQGTQPGPLLPPPGLSALFLSSTFGNRTDFTEVSFLWMCRMF